MVLLLTGRGASDIRTPALIRDYFTGTGPFAEDPPEELAQRRAEGAYVAQVHQRIKQYIRESAPKYQWPRRHSFQARINDLLMLGLLEETGRREEPGHRGAGRLGIAKGFSERVWVRLAPEAAIRPEWADPLGYLILLKQHQDPSSYQNIRKSGRVLATGVPARAPVRVPARVSVRAPELAPGLRVVPIESLTALEAQRQELHTAAQDVEVRGRDVRDFEGLRREVREFNATAIRVLGGRPFPDLADALQILQDCNAGLAAERQMTQQRVQALNNCRAGARLVAEALSRPLGIPAPGPSAPSAVSAETTIVRQAWDRLVGSRPNSAFAERILDRLEAQGVDVAEARDQLEEYQAITRDDYEGGKEGSEEYREARQEAWDAFLEALESTEEPEAEEEEEE